MKILMVLAGEFPPDGRVEKEMNSLIKAGFTVHLACYTLQNRAALEITEKYTIHRKKISAFTYKSSIAQFQFPFYFNFWRRFISSLIQEYAFDAIHIHDLPLAQIGMEMKKKFGVHYVLDLHENYPSLLEKSTHTKKILGRLLHSNKQWRRYEKEMILHPDRIVTVVEEMKKRIVLLGADSGKTCVVSNTIDIESFNKVKRGADPNADQLIYVGGLTYHRGLQYVLEAISILKKEGFQLKLSIVGTGTYRKTLELLALRLGIGELVSFEGWKNYSELSHCISKANFALIPHIKYEQTDNSSPNKLFEYMWNEIPVISSNCSSLERIVNETKAGIIYQYDSPADFAEKYKLLRNKFDAYVDLRFAKECIITKYNWKTEEKELVKLYNGLQN